MRVRKCTCGDPGGRVTVPSMLSFVVLLAAASPAPPPSGGALRVVALPLRDDGAGPGITNAATSLTAVALSKVQGFNVLSGDDVRAAADVDAQKQLVGCDEAGCLAEIAEALGADRIVHGNVARLGDTIVVTLSLFDAKKGVALGRGTVQARDEADLPADLDAAVQRLVGGGGATVRSSAAGAVDWLLVGGLAGAGVGVLIAGAGAGLSWADRGTLTDPATSGDAKASAQASRPTWGVVAVAGAVVTVAGLAAAAVSFVE